VIASLADAWRWYEAARGLARTMARLGEKHWNSLPWEGDLGRDNYLKDLTSAEILDGSQTVLDDLDDLCVLLLFSVFEAPFANGFWKKWKRSCRRCITWPSNVPSPR
jgi:hypothetical protein